MGIKDMNEYVGLDGNQYVLKDTGKDSCRGCAFYRGDSQFTEDCARQELMNDRIDTVDCSDTNTVVWVLKV